jgi:hypothetical protein
MKKQRKNLDFWDKWQHKTLIERKAIQALEKARSFVIQSLPAGKLEAIYIKGSFVRREMQQGCDVDMVPIVVSNKDQRAIWEVNDKHVHPVVIVPLSLSELHLNRLSTPASYHPDLRAKPDRFIRHLPNYKLIYGKPLNPKEFPIRIDRVALKDEIKVIQRGYIPAYKQGKIDFYTLLKEVFWLAELEQFVAGKRPVHSFHEIARSIANRSHPAHRALRFRKRVAKVKEKQTFVLELEKYLQSLREFI